MGKEQNTYLQYTSFQLLENWSVQYLLESKFSYNENFELALIGNFLKRNKTSVDIEDTQKYKRVTIKVNNGGIFLRDKEFGKNIGTKKQFIISKGQFLLSKIDARNGAFGVVNEKVDGAIITGNFWTFDVDYSKINPHFLTLITTTPEFIRFSENASNGTTNRHYLQEDLFLAQRIPLPSLSEQEKIVNHYNSKIKEAEKIEEEAEFLNKNLFKQIDSKLGIRKKQQNNSKRLLQFIPYSELKQWGTDKLLRSSVVFENDFEISSIKNICSVSSGGTPSRSRKEYYTGNIPWIKTTEVKNEIILDTEEKITDEAIKNSSAKLYPKASLIIAMYGQGATRGRTAKLGIDAATNQACAVLTNIDNTKVENDFLWVYLMNEYERLRELASGNNQPNLNAQMIKDYPVVIPPFDIQKEITQDFFKTKEKKNQCEKKAIQLRNEAIQEFEETIFKQ